MFIQTIVDESFYWPLVHRAISATIHSTFSTSLPAIIRDVFIVVYLLFRIGRDGGLRAAMRHFRDNFAEGFSVVCLAYIFGFGWNVYVEVEGIDAEAIRQPAPSAPKTFAHYQLPVDALEFTPPQLKVSLDAQEGFTFDLGPGSYSLENKRQYSLVVQNPSKQSVESVDMDIYFPYYVEAQRVVASKGIGVLTFEPTEQFRVFGGQIRSNGCPASHAYTLHVEKMATGGRAQIILILNSRQDYPSPANSALVNHIYGHFSYRRSGNRLVGEYYAPLEIENNLVILRRSHEKPPGIRKAIDFGLLPPPCIPSTSLRAPK